MTNQYVPAGLFIYAKDLVRLAAFYEDVLGMTRVHSSDDLVVLQLQGLQLVVHLIPPHIASSIIITSPPERREDTALKFFFTVPSIDAARKKAASLGGEVMHENWQSAGFRICNGCDPEGNIFQVRENL
jgi:predicted enzyme related to lactoylglutathione lyase